MLRYLVYGILLYVGYRVVIQLYCDYKQGTPKATGDTGTSGGDVLISCAVCQTRVPRQLMVQRPNGLFCSVACADS
ncbi:MAG: hypothetical protein HQL73_10655 [Magnetococcales bacterium]|nr:hypothetical protein [Magnetococcales bacterium]